MLRVAICDDDLKFTGQIEALVFHESKKLGIRVETEVFSDGKTLLNSIQNGEHYQLIFIDIEMEQVDGITAARCIREIDRTVLLIYVSGYQHIPLPVPMLSYASWLPAYPRIPVSLY